MGVDWITCNVCETNFPDCGPCSRCGECENDFCDWCTQTYVIIQEDEDPNEDPDHPKISTCPFCTKQIIKPETLLAFALKLLGKDKKQLEDLYRNGDKTKSAYPHCPTCKKVIEDCGCDECQIKKK